MWEKGKRVHSRIIERCVIKGKTPVHVSLSRNTSSCVCKGGLCSVPFPTQTLFSSTSMEGTCHHTSPLRSASSQANSIQLGAVRVGCSGSCSVPWPLLWQWPQPCPLELPSFTAHPAASSSQHSPAPGVQAHGLLAKATYRG